MAKQSDGSNQPGSLVVAASELASAIRYNADKRPSRRRRRDLRGVADKLMTWGNLVFAGLVIAQVFSGRFDPTIAAIGVLVFVAAYIFAIALYIVKGGEDG
jgi:hypothetical protein